MEHLTFKHCPISHLTIKNFNLMFIYYILHLLHLNIVTFECMLFLRTCSSLLQQLTHVNICNYYLTTPKRFAPRALGHSVYNNNN